MQSRSTFLLNLSPYIEVLRQENYHNLTVCIIIRIICKNISGMSVSLPEISKRIGEFNHSMNAVTRDIADNNTNTSDFAEILR